jgi:hypothetical protein
MPPQPISSRKLCPALLSLAVLLGGAAGAARGDDALAAAAQGLVRLLGSDEITVREAACD